MKTRHLTWMQGLNLLSSSMCKAFTHEKQFLNIYTMVDGKLFSTFKNEQPGNIKQPDHAWYIGSIVKVIE